MTEDVFETKELVDPLFGKSLDLSNVREVKAPIPMSEIKAYMLDKDITFLLKCDELKMKGKTLMVYLSNAGLPIELDLGTDPTETVKAYMESARLVSVQSLALVTAAIILESRGVPYEHMFGFPFSKEIVTNFVRDNAEMLTRWNKFLDSIPVYFMSMSKGITEALASPLKETYEVIDDIDYLGSNIANVVQVPGFLDAVMGKLDWNDMYYFKEQFEEYIYKGLNLYAYIEKANSSVVHFYHAILADRVTYDEMKIFAAGTELIELDK